MGKRKKQRNRSYPEGTRPFRRVANDPRVRRDVLRGMSDYINGEAADRPNYVRRFFAMWETAVENVDHAAEEILAHRQSVLTKDIWTALVNPYDTWPQLFFARLMDHLDCEELSRLTETAQRLNVAWQKLFASALVRHPELRETVDRLSEARRVAHDEIVDLYTGESLPKLTARWARARGVLESDFRMFAEGLVK